MINESYLRWDSNPRHSVCTFYCLQLVSVNNLEYSFQIGTRVRVLCHGYIHYARIWNSSFLAVVHCISDKFCMITNILASQSLPSLGAQENSEVFNSSCIWSGLNLYTLYYCCNIIIHVYWAVFLKSSYGTPFAHRASYLALHSSLFGPLAQLIMVVLSLTALTLC